MPLPLLTMVPLVAATLTAVNVSPSTSELVPISCALVKVIAASSVALKVTGNATGASLTAETLIVAELGVEVVPSDTLKLKDAVPLKLAAGVNVQVSLPLLTIEPLVAVTLTAVNVLPSMSELAPINCALVNVIAVSSIAAKVTGDVTGASFTGFTVRLIALVEVNDPSDTV